MLLTVLMMGSAWGGDDEVCVSVGAVEPPAWWAEMQPPEDACDLSVVSTELAEHYLAVRERRERMSEYPYIAELMLLCRGQGKTLPPEALRRLIAAGADVNLPAIDGTTDTRPLHQACRLGDSEAIEILLAAGARVHTSDLLAAVREGHTQNMQRLLEKLPESPDLALLLHYAENREMYAYLLAYAGEQQVIPQASELYLHLIDAGCADWADLLPPTAAEGVSPVILAAARGDVLALKQLIAAGADVNEEVDAHGSMLTPLYAAAYNGRTEACMLLLEAGADPDANYLLPVTHAAASCGHVETCRRLLEKLPAKLNENCNAGKLLHMAIERRNTALLDMLLAAGAQADEISLAWAAFENAPECYDKLVAAGAAFGGFTPLHGAALLGRVEECERLIDAGADVNAAVLLPPEGEECTPFRICGRTALHLAAADGRADVFLKLLQRGAKPEVRDTEGNTPLHLVCSLTICRALLGAGAAPDCQNVYGETPLALAAMYGRGRICRELLAAGASPHIGDCAGNTPLHNAVRWNLISSQELVCRLLLAAGARVDARNAAGNTALHLAAALALENVDLCAALLAGGADVNARDAAGRTPLFLASARNHRAVCRLLLEYGAVGIDH